MPQSRELPLAPPSRRPKSGPRAAGPLLAVAALAGATLVFEAGARGLGWGQVVEYAPHDRWGYLMKPSQTVWSFGLPVRINARGLRGPEIGPAPSGARKRVLFVGDSVTHGGGRIAEEDLFVRLFEEDARRGGLDVEAVNLSAPGWSPQNWRAYLEANGLLDASAVVVILPEVDIARVFSTMAFHGFRERAPTLRLSGFLTRVVHAVRPPPRPPRDVPATLRTNLEALEFARRSSAPRPFLVVLLPSPASPAPAGAWAPFEAAFPDAVDLRGELAGGYFQDGLHLNAEGHRLVARRLHDRLRPALFPGAVVDGRGPS